ncbi:CpsD/CapB family tyrosine-protein kinase [Mesorhizobium sp. SP-1A]|uniref:CpsD/CapB family tyrosine-protein kinase n=1 Tax=Mesorhizobium sp. SP-1A TaxID=3077840 RepID=UPI0028F6E011|nr:CpsD/CapB family tyrosine-protein kinase [Mesorhizobium sp. SP-1A]
MERIEIALDKARQKQDRALFPGFVVKREREPDKTKEAIWDNLPLRTPDPATLSASRIVTAYRSDPAYVAFGMLRTRILQEMVRNNWTSIAITSPTAGCGKTLVSLNLAFSFAKQKDYRTLLIDLDLSRSRINELLGAKDSPPVDQLLQGAKPAEEVFVRYADNLAFATNARPLRFTAELLQNARTGEVLKDTFRKLQPDIVIYDMPPMLCNDDLMAFLPNVDCALLVTAAETTRFAEVEMCERELAEKTNLLGVVLNKCRYTQEEYGY